jgi:hypothetical protein
MRPQATSVWGLSDPIVYIYNNTYRYNNNNIYIVCVCVCACAGYGIWVLIRVYTGVRRLLSEPTPTSYYIYRPHSTVYPVIRARNVC